MHLLFARRAAGHDLVEGLTPRVEPMRQGVHLPQDSTAQNSMA